MFDKMQDSCMINSQQTGYRQKPVTKNIYHEPKTPQWESRILARSRKLWSQEKKERKKKEASISLPAASQQFHVKALTSAIRQEKENRLGKKKSHGHCSQTHGCLLKLKHKYVTKMQDRRLLTKSISLYTPVMNT